MKKLEEIGVSPAPWKVEMLSFVTDADGIEVASCYNLAKSPYKNAYLVAAAPELYAALRMCLALIDDEVADEDPRPFVERTCDAIQAARDALEKAGGAE